MDGALIDQQNHQAVELAILVEAGTKVCDMDPMKKATREQVLHCKYLKIIYELEDNCFFEDTTIRTDMTTMFKGSKARQGLSGSNLLRKLERMTEVWKFAVKFPGFNNLLDCPVVSLSCKT